MTQAYKTWIQDIFDRSANAYGEAGGAFFNDIGKELVSFADLENCQTVLDVATGKGAVLKQLAEKLTNQSQIYGVDLSVEMIKALQSSISNQFSNVQLQQMDAEKLDFADNYFDRIFCAFALFFFPNPTEALKQFRRTLKKQGILYLSIWNGDSNLDSMLKRLKLANHPLKPIAANAFESDSKELHQILKATGFANLSFKKINYVHPYADVDKWWNSLWSHAYRGYLEQLTEDELKRLKEKAFDELRHFTNNNGQIIEEMPILFIEAK